MQTNTPTPTAYNLRRVDGEHVAVTPEGETIARLEDRAPRTFRWKATTLDGYDAIGQSRSEAVSNALIGRFALLGY